ncbi:transposase [Caballeronia arationis]|jgi:transposase|uniref:Transposase IS116/IS110/IS902 family protein n=1 Tax=Caballeronia arationis TaxID=1777142 RepID=A0A7Z7I2M4_9BURK|nr:IS110 family transposase [Caballeronia arationis]SAK98706.1 transposase [Caballeronia arationis]SOE56184.1 Transposase IS116/IS110/IS902 family protein [Caballeronia arationis]
MSIVTVGIDRAKNVFAIHGVDETGKAVMVKPKVTRDQLVALIAQLPPSLIGMEACSGAHHWARVFRRPGHTVKLMAARLVAPYRMSGKHGKNHATDAAAICEASEIAREDKRSRRLMQLRGSGPTTASALLASIGAGHDFRIGRQAAAWLGPTPGQFSSGGKARLGSITEAGDAYLRGLLVTGARAVMANLSDKQDRFSRWVRALTKRRGYWRAALAIAAKNARMAWGLLRYGDDFKHQAATI